MPNDPTGDEAAMNIDDPIGRARRDTRRNDVGPPRRRGPRPPFNQELVIKTKSTNKKIPVVTKHVSTAPKKMSKGLRRHLKKVRRNNPAEADRQMGMIGGKD